VIVRVSKGREQFAVPDVLQQSEASAIEELEAAGFEVSSVSVPSDQEAGVVVDQDPDAETQAPRGTTVTISVSEGPQTAPVPPVIGLDRASAEAELSAQGFGVNVSEQPTSNPDEDQLVLDQDPPADSEVEPGTTVTILVAVFVAETSAGEEGD
jgi:serine/threonine-protein kinase